MKPNGFLKWEGLQLALLVVPFLVLIPLWDQFPPRVAIHWGLDGKPNGWADKTWGLLLGPVINLVVVALLAFLPRFDSRTRDSSPETQASFQRILKILRLTVTAFLAATALLIDAVALGWKLDVLLSVNLGLLALFAVMGGILPQVPPNRFVGIRTPWTLKSPEVWARTHRLWGPVMLIGSLLLLPLSLLLPSVLATLLIIVFLLITSFGSMIYSYRCYRALPTPG